MMGKLTMNKHFYLDFTESLQIVTKKTSNAGLHVYLFESPVTGLPSFGTSKIKWPLGMREEPIS